MTEDHIAPASELGRRLARTGVIAATASRLFGRLVGVLFVVVLARTSSDETVAVYGYLLGTATLVGTLTDAGVAAVAGRDVAAGRYDASSALGAALPAQVASILLSWVVTIVLIALSSPPGVTVVRTCLVLLFLALNGMVNLWAELLRGQGRVVAEAVLQTLSAVLLVSGGLAVVAVDGGATPLLVVVAAKEALVLLLSVVLIRPRRAPATIRTRDLLGHSLLLALASTALIVLWRQGMIFVGAVGTVPAVAAYVVASRFLDAGLTVATTVGFGLLPGAAALHQDQHAFRALALRWTGWAAVGGAVASVVGVLVADPLVPALFGDRWSDTVPVVQVFALSAVPVLVGYIAWFLLLAAFEQRWLAVGAVLATVAGVGTTLVTNVSLSAAMASAVGTTTGATVLCLVLGGRLATVLRARSTPSAGSEPPSQRPAPRPAG